MKIPGKLNKNECMVLNKVFQDALLKKICDGDYNKVLEFVAQFAQTSPDKFFKEWARVQPKELSVQTEEILRYVKIGEGKDVVPKGLPVVSEGEGSNIPVTMEGDQLN